MGHYQRLADLPLRIEGYDLEPLLQHTGGGWTRHTTVVRLRGEGLTGCGEDVTYADRDQLAFQQQGPVLPLSGSTTLGRFSDHLTAVELFPAPPAEPRDADYRRWAFESAALDLALRQAGASLHGILGLQPRPVSYVVSTGLGDPASTAALDRISEPYPNSEFKVDLSPSWTEALVSELAGRGAVRVVDLKGQYRGVFQGPPANPDQYRWVAELLPDVWIEDPELDPRTDAVLAPHRHRITWDAILHSVDDIRSLRFEPRCINVKPSRFGTLEELMAVYEHCQDRGIRMYAGGQFELGPGRGQIQYLASLFHPDAPNDVAPRGFNARELADDLPTSPLAVAVDEIGFAWGTGGS